MDAQYSPLPVADALELIAQGGAAAERGAQQLFKQLWRKFVYDFMRDFYRENGVSLLSNKQFNASINVLSPAQRIRRLQQTDGVE